MVQYEETICGSFLQSEEFDRIFDQLMDALDKEAEGLPRNHPARMDIKCERRGMLRLYRALYGAWRLGILSRATPVYNLGIVDQPADAAPSAGGGVWGGPGPDLETAGGDEE